jgi:peptidoglycan/xylan/chitin deacetylase (PgdA/CDA1 family)
MLAKIFYILKPLIPRNVQIFLRRILIKIKVKKFKDVWPILESAGKKPQGFPGWKDNKKFAFVLTHDVELQGGHDKCIELMKLERHLGFRSSFNFVPERYKVSSEVRDELVQNGFEVGVHGLNHDGKLFSSKEVFSARAKKINEYLNQWNAVGFRAPAMHHNLEWQHELNVKYDLSTFDTDPFEPQADGVETIFPFFVKRNGSTEGYWEFPYTLVQDFTLLILMNKSNEIWKKKLDWIAEKGGMALLNVHPDYINFSNNSNKIEEFRINQYEGFLKYVKSKYKNQYWNPLPKELVEYLDQNYL